MKLAAIAVLAVLPLSGCFEVHQKDPLTIKGFERALEQRKKDFELAHKLLVANVHPTTPDEQKAFARDLRDLDILEIAAEDDLKASIWRENQKKE